MSGQPTNLVPAHNEGDAIAVFFTGMVRVVAEILRIADGVHDADGVSPSRDFSKESDVMRRPSCVVAARRNTNAEVGDHADA